MSVASAVGPVRRGWKTPANFLSLTRMVLTPVVLLCLWLPGSTARLVGCAVFAVAAATDFLDGYVARRWRHVTALGAFLDLTADKLLVAAILIELVGEQGVAAWAAIVIIVRELVVSGVRTFAAARGLSIPAGPLGKLKTAVLSVAVIMAILGTPGADVLIAVSALLAVVSAVPYLVAGLRLTVEA